MRKSIQVITACLAALVFATTANADLVFSLSEEPGGGTRFTATGFSGTISAQSPHPTLGNFNKFDIMFPVNFFQTGPGNHLSSFTDLTINGSLAPQVYVLQNWGEVVGGQRDVLRIQNVAGLVDGQAISSMSGSFVIDQVPFSSFAPSLPVSSSEYLDRNSYTAGLVTLNVAAVPEPSSFLFLGIPAICVLVVNFYRRQKQNLPSRVQRKWSYVFRV